MNYLREIHNGEKIILSELMVEVAPHEYVCHKALGLVRGQKPTNGEEKAKNVPIGMSLRPWRRWLSEGEFTLERNWTSRAMVDRRT